MPQWSIGRFTQTYCGVEASYATAPTLLSTMAFRHLSGLLHFNPQSPVNSPARYAHPSMNSLRVRRQAATFDLKHEWYPSGVLNTLPESDVFLANGIGGAASNITLATTVASGALATGATVSSATGLAVGQFVQIGVLGGASPGTYMRLVTVVAGSALTWAPALPTTCAVSDTVKGCITYSLATATQKSIDIAMYPQVVSVKNLELLGCVPNKLAWMFDANTEPQMQISGPAQGFAGTIPTWTAQAQPGAFTTVGTEAMLSSGMNAILNVGAVQYQFTKLQFDLENGYDVQNLASGTNKATAMFRKNKRVVTGKCSALVSNDLTLYTPSLGSTTTPTPILIQQGLVSGQMWAIYAPNVVMTDIPDTPDSDTERQWAFALTCLGTVGNDEIYIGMA
jgi:hypothetical protein